MTIGRKWWRRVEGEDARKSECSLGLQTRKVSHGVDA